MQLYVENFIYSFADYIVSYYHVWYNACIVELNDRICSAHLIMFGVSERNSSVTGSSMELYLSIIYKTNINEVCTSADNCKASFLVQEFSWENFSKRFTLKKSPYFTQSNVFFIAQFIPEKY